MDTIARLQDWYASHCNGDWEHSYGVKIFTLDNPGWAVHINLLETELEGAHFDIVSVDNSETDWWRCEVKDGKYIGNCGSRNLETVLDIFIKWADQCEARKP